MPFPPRKRNPAIMANDLKGSIRDQTLATSECLQSTQPSSQSDTAAMETEERYYNVTEQGQPEEDNDSRSSFTGVSYVNEQLPVQPFVPKLGSRTSRRKAARIQTGPAHVPRVRNRMLQPQNAAFFHVSADRQFKLGMDKTGRPNARIWIETVNDHSKALLYKFSDSSYEKDTYVCGSCARYGRITSCERRCIGDLDSWQLWEQQTHYPGCSKSKAELVKLQAKYDNKRPYADASGHQLSLNIEAQMEEAPEPAIYFRDPPIGIQPLRPVKEEPISSDENDWPKASPELAPSMNSSVVDPHQHHAVIDPLMIPPLQQEMECVPDNTINAVEETEPTAAPFIEFLPKVLASDSTISFNVPSSNQSRVASNILGLKFNKDGLVFWNSCYEKMFEFKGSSKPTEVQNIKSPEFSLFSGFASLAMFLNGDEESAPDILKAIKLYVLHYYVDHSDYKLSLSNDLMVNTLVTTEMTDIHLSAFCKMLGWCVGVFEESGELKIYGNDENNSAATILLKKTGNMYAAVTNIAF